MSYGITYMMVGTLGSSLTPPSSFRNVHQLTKVLRVAQLSGLAFGLSVAGAIFLNLAQEKLIALLPSVPKDQIQQFISGTSGALFNTLSTNDKHQALVILVDTLRTT